MSAIQFLRLRKLPKINSCWDWDASLVSISHLQIIKCLKLSLQTHVNACLKGSREQYSTTLPVSLFTRFIHHSILFNRSICVAESLGAFGLELTGRCSPNFINAIFEELKGFNLTPWGTQSC